MLFVTTVPQITIAASPLNLKACPYPIVGGLFGSTCSILDDVETEFPALSLNQEVRVFIP